MAAIATSFAERIDALTLDDLRRSGATKWAAPDDTIGAFIAEMDFGIAPPITAALHAAVDRGNFGYMPQSLANELSDATASWLLTQHNWSVASADVQGVPDVVRALQYAIEHLSKSGSRIIVPTPAYKPFLLLPPMLGREVIEVPMHQTTNGRYTFDLDALEQAYDRGGHLLVLCNPHNPGGRVFDREELIALSELVTRNRGRVFADEIWAPLVFPGYSHTPYASISRAAAGHAFTAIAASKAWNLPGLKCAQVLMTNDADREIWKEHGPLASHGTSNLGAVASIAAYRDGAAWLAEVNAYLLRNRQALTALVREYLPGVHYREPEGAYIGWLDFRDTPMVENPAAYFRRQAAVHLTDGRECGRSGAGFARFIFALPRPVMQEAFRRMGAVFRPVR
jgi:cysteine-S-conjugate beta-lyase